MYASSRLGVNNANVVMATQEYSIAGYNTTTKSFVNQSVMVNTLISTTVPSLPTIYTVTKGKKQYELSNHLGNVLATISDRRIPRDDNGDLFIDYFNPDIYSTNDYYAFGSSLPGRQGIQKCSMVNVSTNVTNYAAQENFSSGSTGGFVAGTGNRNVSNPTGNVLHLEAFWTTRPLANKTVAVTAGTTYTLNTDIVGFSTVAGYSHTVRIRVIGGGLSTIIANYTSTGAITPITFTPTATGNITIEISSVITGSGTYSINPYIDIDNFSVTYITTTTSSVLACTSLEGYKYGFNTQERDNEIFEGAFTAEFWEYDSRIGRRWNMDPVVKKFESVYACLSGNPILNTDKRGDNPSPSFNLAFHTNFAVSFSLGRSTSFVSFHSAFSLMLNCQYGNNRGQLGMSSNINIYNGGLGSPKGEEQQLSQIDMSITSSLTYGQGKGGLMSQNLLNGNSTSSLTSDMKYSGTFAMSWIGNGDGRNQRCGTWGARIGNFSVNVLEDHKAFFGDGEDRWWTGSGNANYLLGSMGQLTIGSDVFTGNSINKGANCMEWGDLEIGGIVKTPCKNKGKEFTWANQEQMDVKMNLPSGYNQSLNMGQTYIQIVNSYGTFRMSSTGSDHFWSQNIIHDMLNPNFHHFKPATKGNSTSITIRQEYELWYRNQ